MELQIFQNAEFGSVRSTIINGEPYFVGKDVAEILGYADPNKSIPTAKRFKRWWYLLQKFQRITVGVLRE